MEVHPNPEEALVDGAQSLTPTMFRDFMKNMKTSGGIEHKGTPLHDRFQTVFPAARKPEERE
jgi:3-deoxy-D-manno-octulosonic acid (KDO) 8-phosphate synthase